MSLIAEFRLRDPRLPLVDIVAATPGTNLEVDRTLTVDSDQPVVICWVETPSFETFETELAENSTVATYSVLRTTREQRLYHVQLQNPLLSVKTAFVKLGAVPAGRSTITDDGWEIQANFPNRDALARFRDICREREISFRLDSLYEPTPKSNELSNMGLTTKQREALITAYESDYFHIPRRTTLGDLSEQLGISKPSFSKRLRRAQQHVLDDVIENRRL
ncbi:helix-turn-helix domain-containing protein [Haladaptatus sp. SPP-AMP-3]|uniref:helix-turn-helix domain-containing protein n=1 Tax=Haladaptatus sp. SPP-AMP-3 TaxID=3121295 RepID=UPI003C2DEC1E